MITALNTQVNLNSHESALINKCKTNDLTEFNNRFGNKYDELSDSEKLEFYNDIKREDAQVEIEKNYHALKNRTIELLGTAYSLQRLAIETEPQNISLNYYGQGKWQDILNTWLNGNFQTLRVNKRYMDKPSLAELVETSLKALFLTLDNQSGALKPIFVMTSVTKNIIEGMHKARNRKALVEITTPPGSGKTYTALHYQSELRKTEGFNSPIWIITLRESNRTLRHILLEIYYAMSAKDHQIESSHFKYVFNLSLEIEKLALKNKNGLVVIDEAQHIFGGGNRDIKQQGVEIINELRAFTDKELFGIALLSNGEIYKQVTQAHANQLASRMEAFRVDAGKPKAEDVELIMQAYNVKGKENYDWSVKVGTGTGGLRALTTFYKEAIADYGEINIDILNSFRQIN